MCFRPCSEDGRAEDDEAGPAGEQGAELSQDSPGEEMGDSGRGEVECSLPVGGDFIGLGTTGSLSDWSDRLALNIPAFAICCISAEARLLDSFLNRLVFLRLSASRFLCLCLATFLLAILMVLGSLLLPPVLILVVSSAVALRVTASPPLMSSCKTCVWYRPWTASLLMWVTRSPGLKPASKAGDPLSTSITKWWTV